jgi:hypothetical protein
MTTKANTPKFDSRKMRWVSNDPVGETKSICVYYDGALVGVTDVVSYYAYNPMSSKVLHDRANQYRTAKDLVIGWLQAGRDEYTGASNE